ncbi:BTB/POZ domain-containing protein At5g60050 isoform X1 [Primulina eburnea]|uniref:BTB/POZ domain-containing protein At5g60050 isoform X1 n=1 Tax=Primulina eburnea TaxID=1245227 RepID=UPI003C6C1720
MASQKSSRNQHQSVSAMIRQGFISGPFLSPPPSIRPAAGPMNPTLFEMMAIEQAREPKPKSDAQKKVQERVSEALTRAPFRNHELWGMGDVRLTVAEAGAGAGGGESAAFRVSMDVHQRVLAGKSRFFAEKLRRIGAHSVEILECDDVEVYVEAVVLMYSDNLKTKLMGMEVSKVLSLLKVSSALLFDDGIRTCLEYLEAVPWSQDDEELMVSHLNQLQLDKSRTDAVLQRLTAEPSTTASADEIFLKLSFGVLQAKDDKSCKEMKVLISRLLKNNANNHGFHDRLDITRDTLYNLCDRCLSSLVLCLSEATCLDESMSERSTLMGEIAREADNMQWIVGILIDRKMGDEFVKLWGDQKELAVLHSKIPSLYRHEVSKITAQLCISIGRGHVLVPKDTRFSLLSTWLVALYDDFRWMRSAGKSVDKKLIEEGLCRTILTLPLAQQQSILLDWFNRFLNIGDDCPNIQRAFEIWWRRAFVKRYTFELQTQITAHDILNQSNGSRSS